MKLEKDGVIFFLVNLIIANVYLFVAITFGNGDVSKYIIGASGIYIFLFGAFLLMYSFLMKNVKLFLRFKCLFISFLTILLSITLLYLPFDDSIKKHLIRKEIISESNIDLVLNNIYRLRIFLFVVLFLILLSFLIKLFIGSREKSN